LIVSSPPGGSYRLQDISNFVAHGHWVAIFVALYLGLLAVIGLLTALLELRGLAGDSVLGQISWGAGVAAAAALAVGWCVELVVPMSRALGGGKPMPPAVEYGFTQTGKVITWGAGFFLLGCALIAFAAAASTVPAWWRWIAMIGGIAGVLSIAFFPSVILALFVLVLGIGMTASNRATTAAAESG
jgi:hypothetical protein